MEVNSVALHGAMNRFLTIGFQEALFTQFPSLFDFTMPFQFFCFSHKNDQSVFASG